MLRKIYRHAKQSGFRLLGAAAKSPLSRMRCPPHNYRGRNSEYRKFIVMAHPRSGSSMVISALRMHPQIIGFGELFKAGEITFNVEGYSNTSLALRAIRDNYPIEFLERYIFSCYGDQIKAVGFKLFKDHLERGCFGSVWDWIADNKDVKVIILKRDNLLATYASNLVALKSDTWNISSPEQRVDTTIRIDCADCIKEFSRRERFAAETAKRLSGHNVYEVIYESMIEDIPKTLLEMQDFLEVDHKPLKIHTIKKEVRPLSEVIENYDELKESLQDSVWARLF